MNVILMTVLAFAMNDGSCWKATGSVHCKETSGPHQGTPLQHPNCWWYPDEGNSVQSCVASVSGPPEFVCTSPYYEKYVDQPNVPTGLVPILDGQGHSLEGTEQMVCFVRRSCKCLAVEGYPFGICITGDALVGSEPHHHYFYRTHPAGVGLVCQVIGEGGGGTGGGTGGGPGGGPGGLEN